MIQTFIIDGRLPGLNEYVRACRSNKFAAHQMRAKAAEQIAWAVFTAKLNPVNGPVNISFGWVEKDRRRDKDNVAFAKKFILDVLQPKTKSNIYGQGIIQGDGWKHIDGFTDEFDVDKENPRIIVTLEERK